MICNSQSFSSIRALNIYQMNFATKLFQKKISFEAPDTLILPIMHLLLPYNFHSHKADINFSVSFVIKKRTGPTGPDFCYYTQLNRPQVLLELSLCCFNILKGSFYLLLVRKLVKFIMSLLYIYL